MPEELIEYRGYRIEIEQDESPEDPRSTDEFGHMYCWHRRYNLGDKHAYNSIQEFEEEFLNKQINMNDPRGECFALPLYLYDHSGITMSTEPFQCKWDSGQVGWIYITKSEVFENWNNWKRLTRKRVDQIIEVLRGYVKWYDEFLRGEVYGYVVVAPNGDHIDSCWGYYGDIHSEGGLLDSAREAIDSHIEWEWKMEEWVFNNFAL